MSESEKNCGNCLHSYMECEHFHLRQKCRSPEYNSPNMGTRFEPSAAGQTGRGGTAE